MERALAHIEKIDNLQPIEGADKIEVATILGWKVVVKKGQFKIGDECIYCEIDSILPKDNPEFEFMKNTNYRVKTIRLRKQISQGIAFPMTIMFDESELNAKKNAGLMTLYDDMFYIGEDVTEQLGVTKWEPVIPVSLSGITKSTFPSWIPKTDEDRIQNRPGLFNKFGDVPLYSTEKLDGTSATYYLNDDEFGVCSRRLELLESEENTYWQVAHKYNVEEKLRSIDANLALQGEIIGPGIQGNKYKLKEHNIFYFNAYDIKDHKYLDFENFNRLIEHLGFNTVPILQREIYLRNFTMESILLMAEGFSKLYQTQREGVVYRSLTETSDDRGNRISFKAISNKFLLKHEGD